MIESTSKKINETVDDILLNNWVLALDMAKTNEDFNSTVVEVIKEWNAKGINTTTFLKICEQIDVVGKKYN
jgi:hypothetical protein